MTITIKGRTIDLTTNQKINAMLLCSGFLLLATKIGIVAALGFACLAVYARRDEY